MDKSLILKGIPPFNSLRSIELKQIAERASLVHYARGDIVYREGEPGDALYVVVSGRLKAYVNLKDGEEKVFTYFHNGDYFGEVSLLTEKAHSANVRAISDSVILKLDKNAFYSVINKIPSLALHLGKILSARLRVSDTDKEKKAESKVISIFSAVPGVGKTTFAINLATSLAKETRKKVIFLDMGDRARELLKALRLDRKVPLVDFEKFLYTEEAVRNSIVLHTAGFYIIGVLHTGDESKIAPLLGYLAANYDYIVIDLPDKMDKAIYRALMQSDEIFLLTDKERDNINPTSILIQRLHEGIEQLEGKTKIVLTRTDVSTTMLSTSRLEKTLQHSIDFFLKGESGMEDRMRKSGMPLLCEEPESSYCNTVRYISRQIGGKLIGLALGSGTARGLAHIGVLRVFEQEGIDLDIIAGSSIGSLMAAAWASGKNADDMERIAMSFKTRLRAFSLLDMMLPRIGLIRGKNIEVFLRFILGDKTFADTRVPLKIVSVDLDTGQEVIIDKGYLYEAVHASIAIPGIFYPVRRNSMRLVDGGILDPVPVGVLSRLGVSKIIAVNVLPDPIEAQRRRELREKLLENKERKMAERNFISYSIYKINRRIKGVVSSMMVPKIIDVTMRTNELLRYEASENSCRHADVVIRPLVPEASWADFNKAQKFIRRGEKATRDIIPDIKKLVEA